MLGPSIFSQEDVCLSASSTKKKKKIADRSRHFYAATCAFPLVICIHTFRTSFYNLRVIIRTFRGPIVNSSELRRRLAQ